MKLWIWFVCGLLIALAAFSGNELPKSRKLYEDQSEERENLKDQYRTCEHNIEILRIERKNLINQLEVFESQETRLQHSSETMNEKNKELSDCLTQLKISSVRFQSIQQECELRRNFLEKEKDEKNHFQFYYRISVVPSLISFICCCLLMVFDSLSDNEGLCYFNILSLLVYLVIVLIRPF